MNKVLIRNLSSSSNRLFVCATFFICCLFANANQPNNFANIIVKESYANAKDISKYSVENEQHLFFYNDGKELYFTNEVTKSKSRSYGKVTDDNLKKDSDNGMDSCILKFKWNYQNTYDDETGVADVYIKMLNTSKGVACRVIIISENMDHLIEYRGVLNDSLDSFLQNFSSSQKQSNNYISPTNKTPLLKKRK